MRSIFQRSVHGTSMICQMRSLDCREKHLCGSVGRDGDLQRKRPCGGSLPIADDLSVDRVILGAYRRQARIRVGTNHYLLEPWRIGRGINTGGVTINPCDDRTERVVV